MNFLWLFTFLTRLVCAKLQNQQQTAGPLSRLAWKIDLDLRAVKNNKGCIRLVGLLLRNWALYTVLILRMRDALPLSYKRLVGANVTKLSSCNKHSACCYDRNVNR